MTGLNYVSNDNELHADRIFNDGYTAPELYAAGTAIPQSIFLTQVLSAYGADMT
jgi:hypothetical protein